MPEKRLTLNSEKRKAIADVFQNHFEQTSPKHELHKKSIADYNEARTKMKVLAETVVRHHQPQEDVDTIRSMIAKYNSSGGALYDDNCFYFTAPPRNETDSDGRTREVIDEEHVKFDLSKDFANQLCMHIAAMSPQSLDERGISQEFLESEKKIMKDQLLEGGKKPEMIDKIILGKVSKIIKDNTLLGQKWVINPELTVQQAIDGFVKDNKSSFSIEDFVRYKVGEGIEVKKSDFANEVKDLTS